MGVRKATAKRPADDQSVNELERARARIAQEISDLRELRGADGSIDKAIGVLQKACDTLSDVVPSFEKAITLMHNAMFGYWDKEKLEEIPGFQSRLKNIETCFAWMKRTAVWVGGPILTLLSAKAVGVPTESIGHTIANHVTWWTYLLNHQPPQP